MVQVNEKLSRIAPQSDASYIVGYASVALNRPRQALEWLNRIDPQSAAFQGWFPYWEAVTAAHHLLGQHRTELKAAREARSQYPDRPDVLSMEVRALVARGQVDGLNDLIAKHFATRPQTDPSSRLRLYVSTLKELQAHGYGSHAHELAEHALRQHQPMSGDTIPAEERAAYAQLLYANQKWQEARRLFLRLALDDPTNLDYQGYVGTTAAHLGDRGEALRVSQQLASLDRPYLGGSNMLWCARIAAVLRDRTAAVRFLRLAFQAGAAFGIWVHQDLDFDPLRQDPEFLELIRPKN